MSPRQRSQLKYKEVNKFNQYCDYMLENMDLQLKYIDRMSRSSNMNQPQKFVRFENKLFDQLKGGKISIHELRRKSQEKRFSKRVSLPSQQGSVITAEGRRSIIRKRTTKITEPSIMGSAPRVEERASATRVEEKKTLDLVSSLKVVPLE